MRQISKYYVNCFMHINIHTVEIELLARPIPLDYSMVSLFKWILTMKLEFSGIGNENLCSMGLVSVQIF